MECSTLLGEVYIGCLAQSVVSNKGLIKVSVPKKKNYEDQQKALNRTILIVTVSG